VRIPRTGWRIFVTGKDVTMTAHRSKASSALGFGPVRTIINACEAGGDERGSDDDESTGSG